MAVRFNKITCWLCRIKRSNYSREKQECCSLQEEDKATIAFKMEPLRYLVMLRGAHSR